VSPDGQSVAFVRTTVDAENNKYRAGIFVAPTAGGRARPFTSGLYRDGSPRWSPDGRYLAFVSGRDVGEVAEDKKKEYGAQLYVMPTGGGEARRVTDIKGGIMGFEWSPDGSSIAFTSAIDDEGPEFLDQDDCPENDDNGREAGPNGELEKFYKKYNKDVKHIDRIFYRFDGRGYLEDKRSHVFVLDIEAALQETPGSFTRPTQVTDGDYDHGDVAWSPDGTRLAVSACREEDADLERYSDLWIFPVCGDDEPVKLTKSVGPVGGLAWAPEGDRIAYLGHAREQSWYSVTKVWVVAADGSGEPECLTAHFNRSFGDQSITDMRMGGQPARPVWSPDGSFVYITASDSGATHLYTVDMSSGEVARLTEGDITLFGYSVVPAEGKAAFAVATPDSPTDIYTADLGVAKPLDLERLTAVNEDLLSRRIVSLPEHYTFSAEGGPEVDGWAVKPVGHEAGKKYPTVLQIHGGPMAMYTPTFFFEFQLLAAAGIGVIYTNPRGSQGYGEDFCSAIWGDWGNVDYQDVMAGVDAAVERFDWIDPDQLGIAGGSYGGYMSSWVIGHTDRFKAACVMRPVTNCYSFFGTSDGGYRWDEIWGKGQPPWENPDDYLRQSPITYVGNVKTPTLLIHSENDHRCIIEQAEQFYIALKKLGIEAEFLRYPNESHGLSRGGQPWHRIHRLRHIVDWFEDHLEPRGE